MPSMDLEEEKRSLIQRIQEVDDKDLIRRIESLLDQDLKGGRTSAEQYNEELDEAEKEIEEGKLIPHEQIKRKMKKW